jgi:hypothetical protein
VLRISEEKEKMNSLWSFIVAHQVLVTLVVGYTWSAFISALPAPQINSSPFYVFIFRFFNVLAANISRAQSTRVEQSPNFQAALNKQTDLAGVAPIVAVPVPKV